MTCNAGTRACCRCRLAGKPDRVFMPWRQAFDEKHALEQRDVLVDRLPRQLERGREVGDVDELGGVLRGEAQKLGQRVERTHAAQVANVALDLRLKVVAIHCGVSRGSTDLFKAYRVREAGHTIP